MANVVSKCGCEFVSNEAVADKVRSKGAANNPMPDPAHIECVCGHHIIMDTLVYKCPHCKMTYAVTPCSAMDHDYIVKAGIDY
ncbi:MAG: hypothetical protein K0Q49_1953 [Haloplasmataceae bacterium]|nr:hypothetical protein [Haloplasmataceae bacterium]